MNLENKLNEIMQIILEQANKDKNFENKLISVLYAENNIKVNEGKDINVSKAVNKTNKIKKKREAAKFNPLELVLKDRDKLREELMELTIDELKDIIYEYGLDLMKKTSRWKKKERFAEFIIESSEKKISKGDAFRK